MTREMHCNDAQQSIFSVDRVCVLLSFIACGAESVLCPCFACWLAGALFYGTVATVSQRGRMGHGKLESLVTFEKCARKPTRARRHTMRTHVKFVVVLSLCFFLVWLCWLIVFQEGKACLSCYALCT